MEKPNLPQENMPTTAAPTPKPNNLILVGLGVLLLLSLVSSGFLCYQNKQLNKQIGQLALKPTPALLPSPSLTKIPSPEPTVQPAQNADKLNLPIVVFEPPLSTPEYVSQRAELQKKVVEPYVDYHKDTDGNDYLVSLLIQLQDNENIKNEYPYSLIAINKMGGAGWESLMKTNGILNWWIPTCMDCQFTEEFKAKYPEIVANFGL